MTSTVGAAYFPTPAAEPQRSDLLVTNIAERLNEQMALEPQEFSVGELVTICVLVDGNEQDGALRAKAAVITRSEAMAS